ncbi:DUF6153 family protein [Streptosporangium pseudovulgare]|uniref:Uncharacterized protein n=1 Tax=Streptosporangium pseudovulgare TaxID=35765 RepID=A0ABQ2RB44_9ACTN|nr:DUF6153 family protein [Streptosporangium pseudovulgare]GGQ17830.1 hypothetical protein GCM10010140_55220 [Streptosporangium pseudovulgare]
MDDTIRRPALPAYRWLLLVALVLGIAGMHTLGHLDHGGRHDGMPGMGEAAPAVHALSPAALSLSDHGDTVSHLAPDPGSSLSGPGGTLPSSDPSSVCLAVLTSLVLFLAGAAWAWTRRSRETRPAGVRPAPLVARPPPRRTALRLARLSVLRI